MILIGITGKKYAGKTTLANLIQKATTAKTIQIAFADAVKEEVAKACGVTVEQIEQNKQQFRPILQWWGTDFRRKMQRDDYWIQELNRRCVNAHNQNVSCVIIPDCRFQNEAQYIKSIPASWLVRIKREATDNDYDKHASETELETIATDLCIHNNGTLNDLYHQARTLIEMINKQNTPKHHV